MKKVSVISMIALAVMLMIGFGAKAQDKEVLVSGGLTYGSNIGKPGIFIGGVYKITPEWEGAADFTYFFSKKQTYHNGYGIWRKETLTWTALNFNAHYLFYNEDQIEAYGIGGLSMLFEKYKDGFYSNGNNYVGLNLGAGGRYHIADKLYGVAEAKYVIIEGGYLQISAGIVYKLNF